MMPFTSGKSIGHALVCKPGFFCTTRTSIASLSHRCHHGALLLRPLRGTGRRGYASGKLDLVALDKKWQNKWQLASETPATASGKSKSESKSKPSKYILPMFPYPSGNLHLGHLRVYTLADVVARFHMLQGYDVMLPMGWDAFGLPAENAAMERGVDPAAWTRANIARMKEQLDAMNGSWDWSREFATCDPSFYKHTQKIFLLLLEKGLAYQAEAEVNYDPVDKTVLANEQVDANGRSWRSGAKVEKRRLKQWFLRISAFRDSLLEDLDVLAKNDAWPEHVVAMQKNWLGKSHGALIKFPVMAFEQDVGAAIEVFTTRPDTLFGVQYIALAATHPVVADLARNDPELQAFVDTLPGLPPDSKVGYLLPHLRAINPLAYQEDSPEVVKRSLPVYVAPYVLGDYGEGAVMGVPGHDVRDHSFWREHHSDEPVRIVLAASEDESTTVVQAGPFVGHGVMTEHSGLLRGKPSREAGEMLVSMLEAAQLARPVEKWRLRDWLISRQRYWGTPIPVVHCASCGAVPVPDDQLPVELPAVDHHWIERKAGNPLESLEDWIRTPCPSCGSPAKRDTDTMDTFVDSSWYYMRFVDPHNEDAPFATEKAKALLPVDLYIGGVEHAILHLLYARFIYKFTMTSSLVQNADGAPSASPASENEDTEAFEPFRRLITQGMVHGKTYSDPATGRFLKPDEVDFVTGGPDHPRVAATGAPATVSFEKMSKSKHNGVDPTAFIARYGADATRAHMLFQAPVSDVLYWDERKIAGITRWLGRVHTLVLRHAAVGAGDDGDLPISEVAAYLRKSAEDPEARGRWDADCALWLAVQRAITSVTAAYRNVYVLNTAVSDLMGMTNAIAAAAAEDGKAAATATPSVRRAALDVLLRLMAPITPAFAEECWSMLRPVAAAGGSIFQTGFPVMDSDGDSKNSSIGDSAVPSSASPASPLLQPRRQTCAVQVNGKLRFVVEIPVPPAALLSGNGNDSAKDALRDWIVGEILKTEAGQTRLALEASATRKVHIVRGGRLVNFVFKGGD